MSPTTTTGTTNNLSSNIKEIHLSHNTSNDTDCIKSNPSFNYKNQKHCDDDDDNETKNISYSMDDNDKNDDSTCEFETPTPWYGSAFVHWLVFDVIG
mmetsp:Transcript_20343/g.22663  ORF Transcript_20343/g.22663 Transcript_20343/m.22663 type:complete len:97 (-) Transcript_20343:174-464(-)